jgi:hydrogenase large subunit
MSTIKIWIDPITRIEGHLALYAEVNSSTKHVTYAKTVATMFRGFEVILRGRPPEDAIAITSRSCGVCGAAHANGSVVANDVAAGLAPKPMGVALRALAYAMTDYIYDHSIILNLLGGPDYSEMIVSKLTPSVWQEAQSTPAKYSDIHGYRTIADIMADLNPIQGKIWQWTVYYQRIAREAGVLIYGRHSHPSTLIPGGISTDLSLGASLFEEYYTRLSKLIAWVKFVWAIWRDIYEFYKGLGYWEEGKTHDPPIEFAAGWADHPDVYYNAAASANGDWRKLYEQLDDVYRARAEKPGVAVGNQLVTTSMLETNRGWLEFVDTSFYVDWAKHNIAPPTGWISEDPTGQALVGGRSDLLPYHPWNKTTIPKPGAVDFAGKYSWDAEPRLLFLSGSYSGQIAPIETNPISQLWIDTLASTKFELAGVTAWESNGSTLTIHLPGGTVEPQLPSGTSQALDITWDLPKYSTTIERVLARATHLAMVTAIAWAYLEEALALLAAGKTETSMRWSYGQWPSFSYSFGWWHVPRGTVQHWLVQSGGRIANYQYQAPTTKNVSPANNRCTGPWSSQCTGPFEMSVLNSWVTEETPPDQWTGLDFVRAIRSFDPCLACAVHAEVKGEAGRVVRVVERLVSNACGL